MTEREAALCDLAYAHGMKAAQVMLAQGAEQKVRDCIERLTSEALRVLRTPTRTDVAALVGRHFDDGSRRPHR
jgi:hypothetical protein